MTHMIFDVHTHLFQMHEGGRLDEVEIDTFIARMDRCEIDRALTLGPVTIDPYPNEQLTRDFNTHTINAVEHAPDRLSGLCYLNPALDPQFNLEEMQRCVADGPLVGVKFWIASLATNDAGHDPIMRRCAELDCCVLYHAWYKTTGNEKEESTPADIAHLARRHPNVRIIMAHMMGGGVRGILDVAALENVWIDTSGSQAEAGIIEYALEAVGPERIIFGSDFPGRDFATQLGKIEALDLTAEEHEAICWQNTLDVLGRWAPC